jgi:hypothetical protein
MAAHAVTFADLLAAWLNDEARAWPLDGWTATREWIETLELSVSDDPIVQVIMEAQQDAGFETRATYREDYRGIVGIRQKFPESGAIPKEWLDDRVELTAAVANKMKDLELTTGLPSGVQKLYVPQQDGISIESLCDRIDLEMLRQYSGLIEFKLREFRLR